MQAGLLLAVKRIARSSYACGRRANPRTMLTGLTLAVLAACTADSPTEPDGLTASAAVVPAERVDDLVIVAATDSTIELRWTQVSDGLGRPALYRVKYALPAITWATATIGCNAKGLTIGAPISCTVRGLGAGTTYDFQLMSYRLVNNQWQGATYSNITKGTTLTPGARAVSDLAVTAATTSSLRVQWTQIGYGSGGPAMYRVKYGAPPINWSTATTGCDTTLSGAVVGAPMSCTINGLTPGATYDVQLMSYRVVSGTWQNTELSNVVSGTVLVNANPVVDLAASAATDTTLTVRWTEVSDGTGSPAWYRVRYSRPPLSWSGAQVACGTVAGTTIGAQKSCTIPGLSANATYDVQVQSYRNVAGTSEGEVLSNVASGTTQATRAGIWISAAELASRPTSGADWSRLLQDASRDPGTADIGNQDSQHDVFTLAAALVCVRTGQYCAKARQGVLDAMYTEEDPSDADGDPIPMARWMAVGRNLGSYVIAADLLDLRRGGSTGTDGARVQTWLEGFMTKQLMDNNSRTATRGFEPFHSSANGAAQEGWVYAAVASYLRDPRALDFVWEAFRTFTCDPGAVDVMNIYLTPPVQDGWVHDDLAPCAINPAGTTKRVPSGLPGAGSTRRIDGALVGDMRRGGVYQWMPGYTSYPWVGLEGLIPAAVILERAGYPALAAADRAVLRTHDYLWYVRTNTGDARWFDGVRAREIVHLVNVIYNKSFPINQTIGGGRTVGYTGWTHATW